MSEERFDWIERYLNGNEELSAFTAGMPTGEIAELNNQIEEVRDARLAVTLASMREQIGEIHTEAGSVPAAKRPPEDKSSSPLAWVLIVLALLAVFALSFWYFSSGRTVTEGPYAYQDPGLPVVMGLTDDPAFAGAMTLFKQARYEEAQSAFLNLAIDPPANDTLTYYLGASAFYAGDMEYAVGQFTGVIEDDTSLFRERAEWLTVLAFLQTDQQGELTTALDRVLARPQHRFLVLARKLDADLKE